MRCLFLSPFLPYPAEDGGRIRIHEILKGLSASHDVSVLALVEETSESWEAIEHLRAQDIDVQGVPHRPPSRHKTAFRAWRTGRSMYGSLFSSAAYSSTLDAMLLQNAFDIVQCEFSYMGAYAPPRPRGGRTRWVLDAHNVEFRLNETLARSSRGLSGFVYRRYADREVRVRRREELEACLRMDRVIAVSASDREILLREAPDLGVDVVPNGVDLDRFVTTGGPESDRRPSAVFIGKMDYRPNIDAVRWFCREILPIVKGRVPAFTFTICGAHPVEPVLELAKIDGVVVTGRVPDTRPHLDDAAVAVVPLRAGSGTRLKMLEAMAMGRPVISTRIGAEGLNVISGEHFAEANGASEFAARIVELLEDPDERERLGRAGRKLVETSYGWPAIVSRLERVYEELVSPSAAEMAR